MRSRQPIDELERGAWTGGGEMAAAAAGPDLRLVGFVGAGRMAEAIAQGLIRAGGSRGGVRQRPGVGGGHAWPELTCPQG